MKNEISANRIFQKLENMSYQTAQKIENLFDRQAKEIKQNVKLLCFEIVGNAQNKKVLDMANPNSRSIEKKQRAINEARLLLVKTLQQAHLLEQAQRILDRDWLLSPEKKDVLMRDIKNWKRVKFSEKSHTQDEQKN